MYELLIEGHAERDLKQLKRHSPEIFSRVTFRILALKDNPRPQGVRKIVDSEHDWRIVVGDYRIVYEIDDGGRTVRIFRIKHRREAYR